MTILAAPRPNKTGNAWNASSTLAIGTPVNISAYKMTNTGRE
jgi:hypothetical protein